HTLDMLENDYYGHESQDGRMVDDRVLEAGYVAEVVDESLGVLGFYNFIDPAKAVFKIFSSMYKGELNPDRTRPLNILDPVFDDVGIGFGAGQLTLQGVSYNVYVVTCDFAAAFSRESRSRTAAELEIAGMINQLRAGPLEVIESLGLELAPFLEADPSLYEVLARSVFPLVPSTSLQGASRAHSRDMLFNDFVGHISSDGKTVEDRIMASGYIPRKTGEAIQFVETDSPYENEAIEETLRGMVEGEIDRFMETGELILLSAEFVDMGIGAESGTLEWNGQALEGVMTTVTAGMSGDWKPIYLIGAVYEDENNDGLLSVGEGVSGAKVVISSMSMDEAFDSEEFKETATNVAGMFTAPLDIGSYSVTISVPGEEPVEYAVSIGEENVWLEHRLIRSGQEEGE
ncbi:MAG: hypothetical protein JW896_05070, partial [Deltaproteobacteria bacterium]|nr:hypothetical protein [Deltaproteobacteria bacterium]